MIEKGTKVLIRGEQGLFTVERQVGDVDDPLLHVYELVDEKGEMFWIDVKNMMPTVGTHFSIDWQDKYDITCPYCKHELLCEPTAFQKEGYLAHNRTLCPHCEDDFTVYFNPYANRMIPRVVI